MNGKCCHSPCGEECCERGLICTNNTCTFPVTTGLEPTTATSSSSSSTSTGSLSTSMSTTSSTTGGDPNKTQNDINWVVVALASVVVTLIVALTVYCIKGRKGKYTEFSLSMKQTESL